MKCSFVGCKNEAKVGLFGLIEFGVVGTVVVPVCGVHFGVVNDFKVKKVEGFFK